MHASAIYSMLENEIVPMFYERASKACRRVGPAHEACISAITPRFSSGRMVAEYMSELYEPAHRLWMNVSSDNFQEARRKSRMGGPAVSGLEPDPVCELRGAAIRSGNQRFSSTITRDAGSCWFGAR